MLVAAALGLSCGLPSLRGALPDLVPSALQFPDPVPNTPHPSVRVRWTVNNQGGDFASSYFDALYVSTNSTLDNTAVLCGSWYIGGGLAPDVQYSVTNTVQLSVGFAGQYYLLLKTDAFGSVVESNEDNNVISLPFTFDTLPADLAPFSALVPDSWTGPPSPTLTLIWAVTNLGPAAATGSWSDAIYLSTNRTWTPDAISLGLFSTPVPVPAGQVYWQTNTVQVPVNTSGTYYLIFYADVGNNLYETNFTNNTLSVPVAFTVLAPDLAALPLLIQTNVTSQANPSLLVIWGVTNQGAGVAQGSWNDSLILSDDNILDFNDRIIFSPTEYGPVAPGGVYWRTNLVQFPVSRSGTYYLFFQADVQDALLEPQLSNNITSVPISFDILKPDLTPVSFQVSTVVTSPPNPSLTLSWGVTNFGPGPALGSWQDVVYLSKDAVLDASDIPIFNGYESLPLDVGDDYWRTNNVQVPLTQSGSYYLIFRTDDGNSLDEPNTNNNLAARPITFTILPPNLSPIALQFTNPITCPPNPIIQLVSAVTNAGVGTAVGYWNDKLYFSRDSQLDSSDSLVFTTYEPGPVPAGTTYWRTNSAQLPVTQSGTYYLIFDANAEISSKIFESNYADNTLAVPITLNIQPPDLAPLTSILPNAVTGPPYPSVTVIWGITNQGIGPATGSAWNDALYLSSDPVLSSDDPQIVGVYEYASIPPGGTLWMTNTVRVPVTTSGTKYWIAQANLNQSLFESDFNNDTAVVPVSFDIRPPDLAPIALQAASTLTGPPSPNVTVVWAVTNQGTGAAVGNGYWSDHLYVSTNSVWDNSAFDVFSLAEQGPVPPGAAYWRTNTVRLPINTNGNYFLFFKPNAFSELVESDYSNNTATLAFTYQVQPPDLAPVSVQAPSTITGPPYPTLTYVWGVTNQGTGAAQAYNAEWIDAVTLSTNQAWDPSTPQLGWSYQSGPVLAGGVYWQTNTVEVPVTQSGQYFLIFNTDAYLTLTESNYSNNVVAVPITFNIQPPDLAPIALEAPAMLSGPPNPSLTIVWGVTNQGIGAAVGHSWVDQLYFSTTSNWTWQATPVGNHYETGPIGPGQSYSRTNTVNLPTTQSGTYYLVFRVDDSGALFESNESNNVMVVPISLTILPPDLAPVLPAQPLSVTGPPNPTFNVVWGVTNQGAGPAIGLPAWLDQVYLSRHPRLGFQSPTLVNSYETGPITPGTVAWQTNSVWAPVVQSGTYYLVFEPNADAYNRLYESDYSNNLAVLPVTFNIQPPDLAPIALQIPGHIITTPNPVVTFVWGITNQGPGAATSPNPPPIWSDVLYISTNAVLGQGEQSLTTDSPYASLPPGGSYWRTNSVTLPITHSGTYYFTIRANDNGLLYEANYTNNILTVPVVFGILPPDLAPLALQVPSVVTSAPNPRLSFIWGVTNQGIGAAQGSWSDGLYLSTNKTFDSTATPIDFAAETGPIPPGGTYWRTNQLQLPIVQSGKFYFFFKVNAFGYLFESDPNNNLLSAPLTLTILPPDLAPIDIQAPSHVTGPPNPSLNVGWGVTNQGGGPAVPNGNWVDGIYLSTTPVLGQGTSQTLTRDYQQQEVLPGGQYRHSEWVQAPVTADGTYYLIFRADADNAIYESDENNNDLAVPITFTIQAPDLAPLALQAPVTVNSSAYPTLKLTWGVTNQGLGPMQGSWQDSIYLSADATLDSGDPLVTSRGEPGPLPAASAYWRTQTVQVPATNSGKYFLIFRAATYSATLEANTNNNVLAVPITFNIAAPDLAPLSFQVPTNVSGPPNPTLTLVWGVTNQGPGDLPAGVFWSDQVSFSTNATPDPGPASTLVSDFQTGPLRAGGSYWRTNTVWMPITQDGTYYLFLKINTEPTPPAFESNYSNNVVVAPVTFHIRPPDLAPVFLLSSVDTPTSPYPFITVAWGITNQGTGSAEGYPTAWEVSVSVSKTNSSDGSVQAVGSASWFQTNSIAPGETYWSTNSFLSQINESGIYSLTLTVNPYGWFPEANTNNNSATNLLSVNIGPSDVAPIFFSGPANVSGFSDPAVTLVWGVTNQGFTAVPVPYYYSWEDRVYISTNSFLDGAAIVVGEWPQNETVPSGGSYWSTNSARLPVQSSGTYYLILQLDAYNTLRESNLSNNVMVIPVTVVVPPPSDLAPVRFDLLTNVVAPPNPTLTLVWGVTNQGTGPAQSPQGWSDVVYLSAVPVPDGTEQSIFQNYETNALPPGGVYWRTNTAVFPVTSSGTYYAVFRTDATFWLAESDYGNNTTVVPVNFKITPADLAPIAFYGPASVTGTPNPLVTVVIGVTNQGLGAALPALDSLYLAATPTLDLSAQPVARWSRTNAIAPGASYWLTNTVRLPVGDGGVYYLIFETDTGNALAETEFLNNVKAISIRLDLSLQPNLAVEDFQAPKVVSGPDNPTAQLIWNVANQGLGPALGPWSDSVFLYTNQIYDPGIKVNTFVENFSLPVGIDYWSTNQVQLPITRSGTYYLNLQVNSGGDLFELEYGDNWRFVPFTFIRTAPSPVNLLAGQILSDGTFRLAVSGSNGAPYTLQASSDLIHWSRVMDFICTNSPTWLIDATAQQFAWRFYRVAPYAGTRAMPLLLGLADGNAWTATGLTLKLDGPLQTAYRVQISTNLADWATLTNFTDLLASPVYFRDTSASGKDRRFYRAVTP